MQTNDEFYYSPQSIAQIKKRIADLEAVLEEWENDNADGHNDNNIEAIKNKINGLKYTLSGKN